VNDEDVLRYYWEELLYLRRLGASFAKSYPKVAARLELESDESPDPHVERLIESFAFLTARIQRNLDNDFPEIAAELLGVLYPHLVDPVPSMTVVRFDVDPARGKLTSGYPVPRHTPLFVHAEGGAICRFRTCFPVDLWPVELTEASFHSPDRYAFLDRAGEVATVLALTVETRADPLHELDMDRLRIHLAGDQILAEGLYELIFNNLLGVVLLPDRPEEEGGGPDPTRPRRLHPSAVQPVGFAEEEALLPYPVYAQPAYRLIQELFAFPAKYHFLDVTGIERHGASERLTLLVLFDRMPTPRLTVSRSNFVLHATPAINLFEKTSEPIRVDHRRLEYRLVADRRREKTTEVHSVRSVSSSSTPPGARGAEAVGGDGAREFAPFYAFHHGMERRGQKAYWHARRVLSLYQDVTGTEMLLSFLDLDFKPGKPPADTVFAHTLCTNRALAEQLPAGTELQSDQVAPVSRIVCLKKPTAQLTPPLGGQTLWRLVSHLSLNYLSLSSGEESLHGLQEILRLYCLDESPVARQQIAGIAALGQRRVARQVGSWDGTGDGWRGFCRGLEVTLTFDESLYVGSSAFLFASVLNRFLGLYAPTNSFTQLRIRSLQREGEWKRWPPMVGARPFR
jgi:type VI secretion system protein ImpG